MANRWQIFVRLLSTLALWLSCGSGKSYAGWHRSFKQTRNELQELPTTLEHYQIQH